MSLSQTQAQRRTRILHLLAHEALTKAELLTRLDPTPSMGSLEIDLRELSRMFPGRLQIDTARKAHVYRFTGDVPRMLEQPIAQLDDDQLAALIAARGVLRLPQAQGPVSESPDDHYHGVLAQALDRLLDDAGLAEEARAIAPDAIAISRFGVAAEEDVAFPLALAAIRTGESLVFTYTNLAGAQHTVHAKPIRLVHIAGEWHLIAWAPDERETPGKIKQYRLSRCIAIERQATPPDHCPLTGLRNQAALLLADAFRATGSLKSADRCTVTLAVSPTAWPFMERRRWGSKQSELPADGLPAGWKRLRFTTTGLMECRHWVLSFGATVRAEQPPSLVTWLREQAAAILATPP